MMLANYSNQYTIQSNITSSQYISGYKVGCSNAQSRKLYDTNEICIGGIPKNNIYFKRINKDYEICEIEVICEVEINLTNKLFKIINYYIGLECPKLSNLPTNSFSSLIKENCLAGDLIIFDEIELSEIDTAICNINKFTEINFSLDSLVYGVDEIVTRSIEIINEFNLPINNQLYISTGGISETFKLNKEDEINFYK